MAEFKADRFTHQDTNEYGQGKKVTTKILETDAKNTEYLLGEVEEIRQQIPATLTRTYAPLGNIQQWSTNMEQVTIPEQDITSNTGQTYHVREQKIWQMQENQTSGHLETEHFITPGQITQIIAPAIPTGTTSCTKSILTAETSVTFDILGTLEAITGSSTGEVQSNSLLQEYYDKVKPSTQRSTFTSWDSFLNWLGHENWYTTMYPFHYWLALEKQKTLYGIINAEQPLIWKPEWIETVKINNNTISEYTVYRDKNTIQIPALAELPEDYGGGDTLTVRGKYLVQTDISTDTIDLSYHKTVIEVDESPENGILYYDLEFLTTKDALRIFKNNIELIQGVDYRYNTKTQEITIYNISQGDYLELIRTITGVPNNLQLFYDSNRDDLLGNVVILPVQVKYVPE